MLEVWKNIKGYPNYQISNFGRVKSFKSGSPCILKGHKTGYHRIVLSKKNIQKTHLVHRLVGIYFVDGKTKKKNQINHKNGNKLYNYYKNIEWCTAKENSEHRVNVLDKRNSQFNELDVLFMRLMYGEYTYRQLAFLFNTYQGTVYRIVKGVTWQGI